jgi:hypothetical protein
MTKTGGPVTREGKEVVRWNATSHGLRSLAPVIPGVEKKEDWEEHRAGNLESLQPEGHLETVLAERVALLSGGEGEDILVVDNVPEGRDIVSCGGGFERVLADKKDVVDAYCEKVRVVHGTEEEVLEQEGPFFESLPPAVAEFFGTFFKG